MNVDQIAMVAHEANRAYCWQIGDMSHDSWGDSPSDLRQSVKAGVQALLDDPSLTPQEMHQRWVDYKVKEGWTHGDMKNFEDKTHPNLLPFEKLPKEEQVKDYLFVAIVRVLANLPPGYVHV